MTSKRRRTTDGLPSESRRVSGALRVALRATVVTTAGPYGYTVTLWSSGALLVRVHGIPRVTEVFALAAGAVLAFSLLALLVRGMHPGSEPPDRQGDRVVAGALNWVAVGLAIGAVALLATIHGWLAWPVSSFAATFLYLFAASAQLAVVTAIAQR
jgi:hypothetical protein